MPCAMAEVFVCAFPTHHDHNTRYAFLSSFYILTLVLMRSNEVTEAFAASKKKKKLVHSTIRRQANHTLYVRAFFFMPAIEHSRDSDKENKLIGSCVIADRNRMDRESFT